MPWASGRGARDARVTDGGLMEGDGWARLRRDVRADYRRLFCREPDRVAGVAVMTDTDNTGTTCVSHFGDIAFLESAS